MLADVSSTCGPHVRASLRIQPVLTSKIMRSGFGKKCNLFLFVSVQLKLGLLTFNDDYNKPLQSLSVFLCDQSPPESSQTIQMLTC